MGSGFITGVVSIVDHEGNRVDTPNVEGDHAPVELQLGSTMAATKTTNGALTRVTINATAGEGGIVLALDTHDDFRTLEPADVPDGTVVHFKTPVGVYVYEESLGAGQVDDDRTILKLGDVSTGSNGRAYSVDAPVLPTIAALRLAVSGKNAAVQVQAFTTADDGGGGVFDYDASDTTSADNGGTTIVASSCRYKRRFSGSVDVRWFNAKADVAGAADGVLSGGSVNNLASASTTFSTADVGKIILIHTPKSAGSGTVATSTSFVENEGYLLTGTSTAFTTELFTGQRIKIASVEYNVVSIASNTNAYIYPAPPSLSGQTFYRSTQHAATISAFLNSHNVTIAPGATIAGSSLRFCYGTDSLEAFNDAIAYAQANGMEVLIPGNERAYALSGPLDQITIPGLKIVGQGTASLAQSVFGSDDWLRTDLQYGSTVRVFSGGFLKVDGQPYVGPTLSHFAVVGPGYGEGTGLGRAVNVLGSWVTCNLTDVMFANFAIGVDFDVTFACTQNALALVGCGRGLHYIGSNTHKSVGLSAQACAVGMDLQGLAESTFTGALFQGNIGQTSTFFRPLDGNNACNQLKFQTCHWENNDNGLRLGNFIRMHAANGTTIAAIEFDACHSGDLYEFEPTQAGTGGIEHIITRGSQFAGSVKPRWSIWTNGGSWSVVDLSNMTGTTMALLSKGSSATPDGEQGFYYHAAINTGPSPDEVSPDLLNGFRQDVIYAADVKINQPKFNGADPPTGWEFTLYLRPQADNLVVTWDASYLTNPWTDSGSSSSNSSYITWVHIGSGIWTCKGYNRFTGALFPSRPAQQVQIISATTSIGYGTARDIDLVEPLNTLLLAPDNEGRIVILYNDPPVFSGARLRIANVSTEFAGGFDLEVKDAGGTTMCNILAAPGFGYGFAEFEYTTNGTLGPLWILVNPGNCTS